MKKIFLFVLIVNLAYSINGTITFYDGTTLDGELSSSDVRHVFITPEGLVMPEKIPVVDIDNFKLDNGIIIIEDGIAQQTYLDGRFSILQRKEEKDFASSEDEEYIEYDLGNLNYFSVSTFYGIPIYFRPSLLLEDDKNPSSLPNLGFDFSLPYFPIGPVNMSVGGRIITFGFDKEFANADDSKKIKSVTIAGLLKTDLQPILNFFGDNIHPSVEAGITYSLGWDENYEGGLGVVVGGTLDYWFENSPLGVRLFGNGYMIPSPGDALTGFGNIGASILLSLKRND